jgi:hypothetical protein
MWISYKKYGRIKNLKSLKKGVGSGVGSGSGPAQKCHGSPTLLGIYTALIEMFVSLVHLSSFEPEKSWMSETKIHTHFYT